MIKLSYKYSTIDKEHQFGLDLTGCLNGPHYNQWVYFYLGQYFAYVGNPRLYPFARPGGKVIKEYKDTHGAKELALLIGAAITKKLNTK